MIEGEIDKLVRGSKSYLDSIAPGTDPQLTTLLHRYLCILLSANIDKSIQLILTEFARTHGSTEMQRFVSKKHQRGTNYNSERVVQTLNSFDIEWGSRFSRETESTQLKDQLDSLYGLRNSISHGVLVNISRPTLDGYFDTHVKIIGLIKEIVLG